MEYVTTETVPPYSGSIKVTWSTPSEPNGDIKQYKVLITANLFLATYDCSNHPLNGTVKLPVIQLPVCSYR